MASSRRKWFEIEEFFAVVHAQCKAVRVHFGSGEDKAASKLPPTGTLNMPPLDGGDPHGLANLSADEHERVKLVEVRNIFRQELQSLRRKLGDVFTEQEVYHLLFPITIHCDELLCSAAGDRADRWDPLQTEYFDVYDGGEKFFSTLERLMAEDETHRLILEVYYFCLNDGFGGRYREEPAQLEDYQLRLKHRIAVEVDIDATHTQEAQPTPVKLIRFPWHYYAVAAVSIATTCGGFYLLAFTNAH